MCMNSNVGTCRGCGAPIIWIKTASGKAMPCDAKPVMYWRDVCGPERIVTKDGHVVTGRLMGDALSPTGTGYISHFATCPAADRFRR